MLFSSSPFIHLLLPSSSYPWLPMVVSFFQTHLLLEVASPFIFLLLHSTAIRPQEAKESVDEEDPRPTRSTWSYTIRLGLASDRMSPFGNLSTNHSSWPVLLMIYNFLPWLCMKPKYIMLCMMIAGPRQPGNEIEIYLTPLVEDLRKLWVNRVDVFDGNLQQTFRL